MRGSSSKVTDHVNVHFSRLRRGWCKMPKENPLPKEGPVPLKAGHKEKFTKGKGHCGRLSWDLPFGVCVLFLLIDRLLLQLQVQVAHDWCIQVKTEFSLFVNMQELKASRMTFGFWVPKQKCINKLEMQVLFFKL